MSGAGSTEPPRSGGARWPAPERRSARRRRPHARRRPSVAALLATHIWSVAVIARLLLVVALRAPAQRRWPYLVGTLVSALIVVFCSRRSSR